MLSRMALQVRHYQQHRYKSVLAAHEPIDFLDAKNAFTSKSVWDMVLAWSIFKICGIKPIVTHCDSLYHASVRILGSGLVHGLVKRTFFAHFCAGQDTAEIAPRIEALRQLGVGSILDYAAEAALESPEAVKVPVTARIYEYQSEEEADRNGKVFELAVRAVKDTSPEGFAAVKVSALGDPVLLERISTSLVELRRFFMRLKSLDSTSDGLDDFEARQLSYDEFRAGWHHFFSEIPESEIKAEFRRLDTENTGSIDFMEWTYTLQPEELSRMVIQCKETGPLAKAALSPEELLLLRNLQRRVHDICSLAKDLKVRVMLDAEWVAIQPAIDHLALNMQREFNTEMPVVFNTYQTYLRSAYQACLCDLRRSEREGWSFGAKLVRGAYMVAERERAERLGIRSPVWDCFEESEQSFHRTIRLLLERICRAQKDARVPVAEMMVASHNRHSVQLVVESMKQLGIPPSAGIYFGQLLGMADHITFPLGQQGYKAYKYVPYGPVDKVMPYLIRRTQENSTFLGSPGIQEERAMIGSELRRRLAPST